MRSRCLRLLRERQFEMRILFTICGRAGSKGIRNKNVREFLGKPLPLYTLSAIDLFLKDNPEIEADIAVNTDSPELVKIFEDNQLREIAFVPRKESLAGDVVGKIAVIQDCLFELEKQGRGYDMVIDLDITSPLRQHGDLQNVYQEMVSGDWDVVFTVTDSRRNPYFNMVKKTDDHGYNKVIASDFTARQQAPDIYDMNASIYAYDPAFLRTAENIFQGKCGIVKMYDTGILDLDHENDFELMEVIAKHLFEKMDAFDAVNANLNYETDR